MKINLKNILKTLDTLCFLLALAGVIPLIIFEFSANTFYFKWSIIIFLLTFICLFFVLLLRIIISFKSNETDEFKSSKGEKVRLIIGIIFSSFCIGWIIFMLFSI